jgi:hypothetical protein
MGSQRRQLHAASLELAIEGEGIGPTDVNIRLLGQFLESAAKTLEAVARDHGLAVVLPALEAVRTGSAAYEMVSSEPSWSATIKHFRASVQDRGKSASPQVRIALSELHETGSKLGSVRVGASLKGKRLRALRLAVPLETVDDHDAFGTVLHGRLTGVNEFQGGHVYMQIELAEGGRERMRLATDALAQTSSALFRSKVRVVASAIGNEREGYKWVAQEIEPWADTDFLTTLDAVYDDLARDGAYDDVGGWLEELASE